MEHKIDISVIVTVYNLEAYIGECLDSILSQEGVNFEVICVDDVSADLSLEILCEYQLRDSRVRVIRNEKNLGLSSSRNVGFRAARGEYLYNIDGDDMLVAGALRIMYENAKKHDLDMLSFSADSFFENDALRKFSSDGEYLRKKACSVVKTGVELFVELYECKEPVTSNMCLYCIRTQFFRENNLFDIEGLRYVDDSMFLKYMKAQRVMCIPDVLYKRRYREGSTVVSPMKRIYLECMIVLFAEEFSCWQQMKLGETENNVISQYFLRRMQDIDSMSHAFSHDTTNMDYLAHHSGAAFLYNYVLKQKRLYEGNITEDDKRRIFSTDKLVIYGAGYFAEKVTDILEVYGKRDYAVVVSSGAEDKWLKGHKVFNVNQVSELLKESLVIVAVSRRYKDEISDTLKGYGVKEVIWFD